jgi:hypothetical protein
MSDLRQRLKAIERAVADAQTIEDYALACQKLNWLRTELGDLYIDSCRASPPGQRRREAIDFRHRIDEVDHIAYTAIGRVLIETAELNLRRRSGHYRSEAGLLTLSRLVPKKQRARKMMIAAKAEAEGGEDG